MRIDILNKKIGFGGIVSNIDLTKNLDKNIIKKIDDELNNLCVLVFKNQKLNDEQQLNFSKCFGKIEGAGKNTTIRKASERRISDSFGDVSNLDVNNKPFKKNR